MTADARQIAAIAKALEGFDNLTLTEGLTVSGGFETQDQRIYFGAGADGTHRITGAGPL